MSTQVCGCDPEAGHQCDRCRMEGLIFAIRAIRRLGMKIARRATDSDARANADTIVDIANAVTKETR